jgi:hypothetical protein
MSVNAVHAVLSTTEAWQFVSLFLEFVVVSQFLIFLNMPTRQQDDMKFIVYFEHVSVAVRVAGVVQIASFIPVEGCIYDVVFVQSEHVAVTNTQVIVVNLSFVCKGISDLFSHILDNNVLGVESTQS